eukprot:gene23792-30859_t
MSLPSNYTDVNQRERIQTSEELVKFITERAAQLSTGFPPSNQLYVFNDDSPATKSPEFHAVKLNSPNNNNKRSSKVRRLQADAGRETAIRVCFADILTIPKDLPPTFST